jgi:hypothetical protein
MFSRPGRLESRFLLLQIRFLEESPGGLSEHSDLNHDGDQLG